MSSLPDARSGEGPGETFCIFSVSLSEVYTGQLNFNNDEEFNLEHLWCDN